MPAKNIVVTMLIFISCVPAYSFARGLYLAQMKCTEGVSILEAIIDAKSLETDLFGIIGRNTYTWRIKQCTDINDRVYDFRSRLDDLRSRW